MMPRSGEITNDLLDKLRAYLVTKPAPDTSGHQKAGGN